MEIADFIKPCPWASEDTVYLTCPAEAHGLQVDSRCDHCPATTTPTVEIDYDDYVEALNNPRVHEFWARAEAHGKRLIENGHCPCHLEINCPNKK